MCFLIHSISHFFAFMVFSCQNIYPITNKRLGAASKTGVHLRPRSTFAHARQQANVNRTCLTRRTTGRYIEESRYISARTQRTSSSRGPHIKQAVVQDHVRACIHASTGLPKRLTVEKSSSSENPLHNSDSRSV